MCAKPLDLCYFKNVMKSILCALIQQKSAILCKEVNMTKRTNPNK